MYRIFFLFALGLYSVSAVDRSKFRTCDDTSFCKKYRHFSEQEREVYAVDLNSIQYESDHITSKIYLPNNVNELNLHVFVLSTGTIRVKITEAIDRWQPDDILQAEGLKPGSYTRLYLDNEQDRTQFPSHFSDSGSDSDSKNNIYVSVHDAHNDKLLVIHTKSLKIELYQNKNLLIVANERNLLHFDKTQSQKLGYVASNDDNELNQNQNNDDRGIDETEVLIDKHNGKEIVSYGEDGLAIYADGTKEVEDFESLDYGDDDEEEDVQGGDVDGGGRHLNAIKDQGDNWEEKFHSHTDKRPHGPMSVGVDIAFPYTSVVYGIPEHTTPMALPTSIGAGTGNSGGKSYTQPYRMYNLDVFEYELDNTMALYGHIPFMIGHGTTSTPTGDEAYTAAVFWYNPSETFIDINDHNTAATAPAYKQTHWMSESGLVDIFLFSGVTKQNRSNVEPATPTSASGFAAVYHDYSLLTGFTAIPPMFSLGYHQCRWNYRDEKDVASVEAKFEELDFPLDVIWLDIEHTDGKRYFTWDKNLFPTPKDMIDNVASHGRKMVTIVDPHIKRDHSYHVHSEATSKGYYIKDHGGHKDFDGWCWPGSSSYLDFTSPVVREWWGQQFAYDKYVGSTSDLYTWNDMNEPSVFNGPEVSMPKDCESISGIEHREWHNVYGMYYHQATAEGLTMRDPKKLERPFVLSRAFFAGTQKHGAIWTGDNTATWGHLQIAAPMLLSINLGGLSFSGADIGGFFGNPDVDLMTRWYQAAAFTPFFRNHAHLDSKRREPWVFGEPTTSRLRTATMIRYSLLPLWYTAFYESYASGLPVMRPLFMEFPFDSSVLTTDDTWMIGSAIMVKPVVEQHVKSMDVYLPPCMWYDYFSYTPFNSITANTPNTGRKVSITNINMDTIPVFIRGGSMLMRKMRLRRSSKTMFYDPFTITIAPDHLQQAVGTLYMDDEHTLLYTHSDAMTHTAYYTYHYDGKANTIVSIDTLAADAVVNTGAGYVAPNSVEKIELLNQQRAPKSIILSIKHMDQYLSNGSSAIDADSNAHAHVEVTDDGSVDENANTKLIEFQLEFSYNTEKKMVVIKKPNILITSTWKIQLEY